MKSAIIPQSPSLLNGELFNYDSSCKVGTDAKSGFPDHIGYSMLREKFRDDGDELYTIDNVNIYSVDICIFIDMNYWYLSQILQMESPPTLVYIMREPPSVDPLNAIRNILRIAPLFDVVFTWNDTLEEISEKFIGYNWPQHIQPVHTDKESFQEQTLLTTVSSRRYSTHPNELYTAREEVIQYFDEHHPERFSLFGRFWNKQPTIGDIVVHHKFKTDTYQTYNGEIDDKSDAYTSHQFALAFENITGIEGCITEKIFDCLRGGAVPVYWGANNIEEYVPKDCFIDYRNFQSPEALFERLDSVTAEEYNRYRSAGKDFLEERGEEFSPECFAETIYENIYRDEKVGKDKLSNNVEEEIIRKGPAHQLVYHHDEYSAGRYVWNAMKLIRRDPQIILDIPEIPYHGLQKLL
ncbi:glycosyltransferase family 10 domain-containing protein [Halobellus sp. EA9]|uniref:glycosyltransferase family 10 domain-containing protein n=1 Tax=Halobellus sp. EA9 TaxID=3421647 RepID=UPI003EB69BF7